MQYKHFITEKILLPCVTVAEGYRSSAYQDVKHQSIGYGYNLNSNVLSLTSTTLSQVAALPAEKQEAFWYDKTREIILMDFDTLTNLGFSIDTDMRIIVVLHDMLYQLGATRFKKFEKMLKAAMVNNISGVMNEIRDSLYYKQVTKRAERNIRILESRDPHALVRAAHASPYISVSTRGAVI